MSSFWMALVVHVIDFLANADEEAVAPEESIRMLEFIGESIRNSGDENIRAFKECVVEMMNTQEEEVRSEFLRDLPECIGLGHDDPPSSK